MAQSAERTAADCMDREKSVQVVSGRDEIQMDIADEILYAALYGDVYSPMWGVDRR